MASVLLHLSPLLSSLSPAASPPLPPSRLPPLGRVVYRRAPSRSFPPIASIQRPSEESYHTLPQLSLPPAAERNVVAEVLAAAEIATRKMGRGAEDRPSPRATPDKEARPLRLVSAVVDDSYVQLVAEEIGQISSGKHAGKSWLRPLAMRTCNCVSLATEAFRYDPALGWFSAEGEDGGGGEKGDGKGSEFDSEVHVFSPLVPAVFLPTHLVGETGGSLALAVRMLCDAHADEVDLEGSLNLFAMPDADQQRLRPFLLAVCSQ